MIESNVPRLRKESNLDGDKHKEWLRDEYGTYDRAKYEKTQTPWFSSMKRYEFDIEKGLRRVFLKQKAIANILFIYANEDEPKEVVE